MGLKTLLGVTTNCGEAVVVKTATAMVTSLDAVNDVCSIIRANTELERLSAEAALAEAYKGYKDALPQTIELLTELREWHNKPSF